MVNISIDMSEYETLVHRLHQEIKARKEAEENSKRKIAELSLLNRQLKQALEEQKKISKKLKESSRNLDIQTAKTEDERHAKSTLQNILESAIEYSIIAINLEGVILVWNEGARRNYGYLAHEMVKKQNIKILHLKKDVESGAAQAILDKAYREGKAEGIFERVRKDGSLFTASVSVSLLKNDYGVPVGYVIISKDITQEKEIEAQLIKTNQELEQFAYIASHDLKAPLRAIERLASWIEEDNEDKLDEESKKNLHLLRQRINRMANLIDGILQYSRAGRVDLEIHLVDIKEVLEEVIDTLNPDDKFKIIYPEKLPVFKTAKVPLSQVFSNLINNGIKHHDKSEGTIRIEFSELDKFYEFRVIDDGPGIEPEYFDKIFVIFQTLKSRDEFEATGIGLSIVKKIIESQGGKISVYSKLNEGTTFCFTWPIIPNHPLSGNSNKVQ